MKAACVSKEKSAGCPQSVLSRAGRVLSLWRDSRCYIGIATGSSLGLPLCLSPLCLSVCVCPVRQQVEASLKVGHEKIELTDMTPVLWEEQKFFHRFLKCRRDAWSCQLL